MLPGHTQRNSELKPFWVAPELALSTIAPAFARELLKVLEACGLLSAIRVATEHSLDGLIPAKPGERTVLDSLFLAQKLHPARIPVPASQNEPYPTILSEHTVGDKP